MIAIPSKWKRKIVELIAIIASTKASKPILRSNEFCLMVIPMIRKAIVRSTKNDADVIK